VTETTEQHEAAHSIKTRQPHANRVWLGIILLSLTSLAGAGYYLFSQLRDRQENLGGEVKGELAQKIADYQQQLTAIQSQIAALENTIAGKDVHFTKTLAEFSELHDEKLDTVRKELHTAILQVQRQLGKTRGDWLVADAEYLLSVANERLHLVGDVNTTREALEAADQRLRESGDAATYKVREQIAREIALLNAVTVPDVVGLYAKIDSMENLVDQLSLILPYAGKPLAGANAVQNGQIPENEEQGVLDSALSKLEGIVTIRRVDQAVNEILSPEEAQFIREQLRVKLEMVKIALVQRNEALFQSGLQDAREWLAEHFTNDEINRQLQAQVAQLMEINIKGQFPDISKSLKMLRDVTALRIETDKALDPAPVPPPVEAPDTAAAPAAIAAPKQRQDAPEPEAIQTDQQ